MKNIEVIPIYLKEKISEINFWPFPFLLIMFPNYFEEILLLDYFVLWILKISFSVRIKTVFDRTVLRGIVHEIHSVFRDESRGGATFPSSVNIQPGYGLF